MGFDLDSHFEPEGDDFMTVAPTVTRQLTEDDFASAFPELAESWDVEEPERGPSKIERRLDRAIKALEALGMPSAWIDSVRETFPLDPTVAECERLEDGLRALKRAAGRKTARTVAEVTGYAPPKRKRRHGAPSL